MRLSYETVWISLCIAVGSGWSAACASRGGDAGLAQGIVPEPRGVGSLAVKLEQLTSCDEASDALRAAAEADMNLQLDRALKAHLEADASRCTLNTDAADAGSILASTGSAATQVSTTNNQVMGVDEADFVKNDRRYIYKVDHGAQAELGAFRILEAWPANQTREIARVDVPGTPQKLFVQGDRAVIYSTLPPVSDLPAGPCVDCPTSSPQTAVLLYDLSDRSAPTLLRRFQVNGSLVAARRIDNAIHTVVRTPSTRLALAYYPQELDYCKSTPNSRDPRAVVRAFEALRQTNLEQIRSATFDSVLPRVREEGVGADVRDCSGFFRAEDRGLDFTSLVSFDLADDTQRPTLTSVLGRSGIVYASAQTLYLAVSQRATAGDAWFPEQEDTQEATIVHAFRIGSDARASSYLASGLVKGRVLNQFSMDEYAGHLRIATTTGHLPNPDAHNTLSVLEQQEDRLDVVGQVDDIAKGEDIRSVRFEGDRGFMVTFKKTDPLFTFDLKDPRAPQLLGELMIPGFSTYIHMLDDKHLLTIGFDADDHGEFAYFDGVILQIFDVSNIDQPSLQHKVTLGTRGSSSEALSNHLAFNFFQGKLALPMTICEGGGDGRYGTNMTFSGLIVYDVDVANGFSELGRVANRAANGRYDSALCSNWWERGNSDVKRSIFMDDYLYAITPTTVHVQDMRALGEDVATVVTNTNTR